MLDNTCLTKLSLKTRQLSDHTLLTVLWLWVWAGTDTDWRPKTRRRMRRVESDGRCRAQLSLSPAPASLGQDPGPHWHQSPEHHVTSHSSKHHHSAHYSLALVDGKMRTPGYHWHLGGIIKTCQDIHFLERTSRNLHTHTSYEEIMQWHTIMSQ